MGGIRVVVDELQRVSQDAGIAPNAGGQWLTGYSPVGTLSGTTAWCLTAASCEDIVRFAGRASCCVGEVRSAARQGGLRWVARAHERQLQSCVNLSGRRQALLPPRDHACAPCDWRPPTTLPVNPCSSKSHTTHGRHRGRRVRRCQRHRHAPRPAHRRRPARREPLCAGRPQELAGCQDRAAQGAPRGCQEEAVGRAGERRLCLLVAAGPREPAAARALPVARLHRRCLQLPPPAAGPDGQCQEEGEPAVLGYVTTFACILACLLASVCCSTANTH